MILYVHIQQDDHDEIINEVLDLIREVASKPYLPEYMSKDDLLEIIVGKIVQEYLK